MMIKRLKKLEKSSKEKCITQNGRVIIEKLIIIFGSIVTLTLTMNVYRNMINTDFRKDIYVANFRTDATIITEVGAIIEVARNYEENKDIYPYGGRGEVLGANQINPLLKKNIGSMGDENKDRIVSEEELNALGLMKLDVDLYKKELKRYLYKLNDSRSLKDYVVITKGPYSGTVLYNGKKKVVDSNNVRYFGIEKN